MCASQLSTTLYPFRCCCAQRATGRRLRHLLQRGAAKGFAALKDGALVDGAGEPFVFASMNLPNIHRIELPEGGVRKPTLAEVVDVLGAADEGARRADVRAEPRRRRPVPHRRRHGQRGVVRRPRPGDRGRRAARRLRDHPVRQHVLARRAARFGAQSPAAQFRRRRAIPPRTSPTALRHRLRRYEHWGTTAYYAQWSGQDPSKSIDFFHDETQQAVFRGVLTAVLERVNSRTGRQYKDEPAILAWETGNELVDVRYGAAQFGAILGAILRAIILRRLLRPGTAPSRACRRRRSGPRAWRRTCALMAPSSSSWTARSSRRRRCRSPGSTSSAAPLVPPPAAAAAASPPRAVPPHPPPRRRRYYNLPASALENGASARRDVERAGGRHAEALRREGVWARASVTSDPNHTPSRPQTLERHPSPCVTQIAPPHPLCGASRRGTAWAGEMVNATEGA